MAPTENEDAGRTTDHPQPIALPGTTLPGAPVAEPTAVLTSHAQEQDAHSTSAKVDPPRTFPSVPGYSIEKVLGRGGMGVVYQARHIALKRTVALKMVLAGGHAGSRERTRFRIEAEAVARLQHPNIVQIHEIGESDGHPFCALEFVGGGSLADKLSEQLLAPRDAAALVESLARAMQVAHARNVVHRDLKPANVLLATDGTPKITDFGLARQMDADSGETQDGAVMGTPSYMAPEQASGRAREAGPPADVYALGAILYECLTGSPPFRGGSMVETLDLVRTTDPVPPSRIRAKVPRDLETICLKAMAKEPVRRYASAGDLADDLRRFLADEPILARRTSVMERLWRVVRRNPVVVGLSVAFLGLAVTVAVVVLRPARDSESASLPTVDTSAEDLLAAIAELDSTDPGWRLEQIAAKHPEIPDAQNGAIQIAAFRKQVAEINGRPRSEGDWIRPKDHDRIQVVIGLPPRTPLTADEVAYLREELERIAAPLATARQMTDYPQGRFAVAPTRLAITTMLPDYGAGRNVALLLATAAMVEIHEGNRKQALADCRAIWNVAAVYQDEPSCYAHLLRFMMILRVEQLLERILAHTECSGAELQEFQQAFQTCARVPTYVTVLRGDRGLKHYFLGALEAGEVLDQQTLNQIGIRNRANMPPSRDIRRIHAWMLAHTAEAVQIGRQPPERWAELVKALDKKGQSGPLVGTPLSDFVFHDPLSPGRKLSFASSTAATHLLNLAHLRNAQVALAVERYRLVRTTWPKTLEDLVPTYLADMPLDPYDGRPLRYRRTRDGVVVYSVGPDRKDDQGGLSREFAPPAGSDVGFHLWDMDRRRVAGR